CILSPPGTPPTSSATSRMSRVRGKTAASTTKSSRASPFTRNVTLDIGLKAMNASKIVIRPTHPDDAQDLYEIVSHPQVARTLLQLPSMEFSETLNWIKQVNPGQHRLVAELNGRVRGQITLDHFQNPRLKHAGRLGMMVHPDYWNQGVGTALMTATMDIADNWLDLKRVQLEVFPHNKAAVHLYEKCGFQLEGRRRCAAFGDGRWPDKLGMARLRDVSGLKGSRELPPAAARTDPTVRHLAVCALREED